MFLGIRLVGKVDDVSVKNLDAAKPVEGMPVNCFSIMSLHLIGISEKTLVRMSGASKGFNPGITN
jgi:hypothetical protein